MSKWQFTIAETVHMTDKELSHYTRLGLIQHEKEVLEKQLAASKERIAALEAKVKQLINGGEHAE